jgi:hypothetical protein
VVNQTAMIELTEQPARALESPDVQRRKNSGL